MVVEGHCGCLLFVVGRRGNDVADGMLHGLSGLLSAHDASDDGSCHGSCHGTAYCSSPYCHCSYCSPHSSRHLGRVVVGRHDVTGEDDVVAVDTGGLAEAFAHTPFAAFQPVTIYEECLSLHCCKGFLHRRVGGLVSRGQLVAADSPQEHIAVPMLFAVEGVQRLPLVLDEVFVRVAVFALAQGVGNHEQEYAER